MRSHGKQKHKLFQLNNAKKKSELEKKSSDSDYNQQKTIWFFEGRLLLMEKIRLPCWYGKYLQDCMYMFYTSQWLAGFLPSAICLLFHSRLVGIQPVSRTFFPPGSSKISKSNRVTLPSCHCPIGVVLTTKTETKPSVSMTTFLDPKILTVNCGFRVLNGDHNVRIWFGWHKCFILFWIFT